jgi:hypothetical protein
MQNWLLNRVNELQRCFAALSMTGNSAVASIAKGLSGAARFYAALLDRLNAFKASRGEKPEPFNLRIRVKPKFVTGVVAALHRRGSVSILVHGPSPARWQIYRTRLRFARRNLLSMSKACTFGKLWLRWAS